MRNHRKLWLLLGSIVLAGIPAARLSFPTTAYAEGRQEPAISWTGTLSQPSKHTPVWIGYTFLEANKRHLGIRNPRQDLIVTDINETADQRTLVRFQRYIYRTPVWGDGLTFEIDREGVIRRVEGTVHADLELQLFHRPKHPAVSAGKAGTKAGEWLRSKGLSAKMGEVQAYYLPDRPGVPLVYAVSVGDEGYVLVHAMTGRVIRSNI